MRDRSDSGFPEAPARWQCILLVAVAADRKS